jgi:prepilin-type processing-associated H-X9-DG protein
MPFGIIQPLDWMSGMGRQLGLSFDEGPTANDRANRFHQLAGGYSSKTKRENTGAKMFRCPENDIQSTQFGLTQVNPHPMMSYVTALGFQYRYSPAFSSGNIPGSSANYSQFNINFITLPGGYTNKIPQVGNEAAKIFMADGARWWNGSGGITTTLTMGTTSPGGEAADYGPWSAPAFARSYRYASGAGDGRGNAMRHGETRRQNALYGALKMNTLFFDGHAESLHGKLAANPGLWVPSQTIIPIGEAPAAGDPGYAEVTQTYWPGSGNYVAP